MHNEQFSVAAGQRQNKSKIDAFGSRKLLQFPSLFFIIRSRLHRSIGASEIRYGPGHLELFVSVSMALDLARSGISDGDAYQMSHSEHNKASNRPCKIRLVAISCSLLLLALLSEKFIHSASKMSQ
jgi:hypothetical protein